MEKFEFGFKHIPATEKREGWGGYPIPASPDSWMVFLPHQCEKWEISRSGATREQAIEDLEAFIAEALETLAKLRSAE